MLKVALSGCNGKMGRTITDIVSKKDGMNIICGFDINPIKHFGYPVYSDPMEFNGGCDVIIDFSNPFSIDSLINYCLKTKTPIVICTTGFDDRQNMLIETAAEKIPIFRSGNMSVGINLVMDLIEKCVNVLGNDYDIEIVEKHHNQKIDAPSGTALMLADSASDALATSPEYMYDRTPSREKRGKNEIGIHAIRGGTIVGEHSVIFAGRDEIIEIKHSALSREIFAVGATRAAEFLAGCSSPGLYNMKDLIKDK